MRPARGHVFFGGGVLIAALVFVGTALAAPAVLVEAGGKVPSAGEVR